LNSLYTSDIRCKKKKRGNDKFILTSTNPTKVMWQLINKEIENFNKINHNIVLKKGSKIITNPQYIAEQFNAFFVDSVENLVVPNNHNKCGETPESKVNYILQILCLFLQLQRMMFKWL
jgi:acetylglutamate synthase